MAGSEDLVVSVEVPGGPWGSLESGRDKDGSDVSRGTDSRNTLDFWADDARPPARRSETAASGCGSHSRPSKRPASAGATGSRRSTPASPRIAPRTEEAVPARSATGAGGGSVGVGGGGGTGLGWAAGPASSRVSASTPASPATSTRAGWAGFGDPPGAIRLPSSAGVRRTQEAATPAASRADPSGSLEGLVHEAAPDASALDATTGSMRRPSTPSSQNPFSTGVVAQPQASGVQAAPRQPDAAPPERKRFSSNPFDH